MTDIADPSAFTGIDHEVDKIVGSGDGKTLDELEDMRRNYLFWFYIGLTITAAAAVILIGFAQWHERTYGYQKDFDKSLFFIWIIIAIIGLVPIQVYENKARGILMPALVKLFGDLEWSPRQFGDDLDFWQDLRASHLIGTYTDTIVHDFITGTMQQIPVVMAEMTLSYGSGKQRTVIFKGAGISIHLQKTAPLWLMLKPHRMALNLFPNIATDTEVKIPSPDFTRNFSAYSNDQVLARTLLTPDVVEQITKIALSFGNRAIGIGLRGDCLFLMAHGKGELAPASLFTSAYKLEHVHTVGRQLYLLSTLIETTMKDWRLNSATPYQLETHTS